MANRGSNSIWRGPAHVAEIFMENLTPVLTGHTSTSLTNTSCLVLNLFHLVACYVLFPYVVAFLFKKMQTNSSSELAYDGEEGQNMVTVKKKGVRESFVEEKRPLLEVCVTV